MGENLGLQLLKNQPIARERSELVSLTLHVNCMLVFHMEIGEVVDRCVEFREEVELGETDEQCLKHMYTIR